MALCDEIYLKYPASELIDLDAPTIKLWREGQERWCQRTHGMSVKEYGETFKEPKEYIPYEFNDDGVGGYGSSGRKPLPKEYWDTEVPCVNHPDAPHGFDRNGSHNANHYVCECQGWYNGMIDDIILVINNQIEKMELLDLELSVAELKEQRKFMEGLRLWR